MCDVLKKGAIGSSCPQTLDCDPETMEVVPDKRLGQASQLDHDFWELEALEFGAQTSDVQGRIEKNISFWKEVLHGPQPVLDCINSGYCLPLKLLPSPYSQNNHKSAILHKQFVDAMTGLLKNCCAVKVSEKFYICSPLSVMSNSTGKLHLVLNLRYLNHSLHTVSFKYENLLNV